MPKAYLTIYEQDDPRNPVEVRADELPALEHQGLIRRDDDGELLVAELETAGDGGTPPENAASVTVAQAGKKVDAPPAHKDNDAPAGRAGAPKNAPKE